MKDILGRMNKTLDSIYASVRRNSGSQDTRRSDLEAAWEELDQYLKAGKSTHNIGADPIPPSGDAELLETRELARDYHNLEIKPGAQAGEVKAAYRRMLKHYHPDRFASDPEKQLIATQISAKLNQSYRRITEHLESHAT